MPRFVCVVVLGLAITIPAVGIEKPQIQPVPPQRIQPVAPPAPAPTSYVAPKADGAVVALLDEGVEPLFTELINDGGGEAGTIVREDRDVFAGVEAVRVTPMQKYRSNIPGWTYQIVEKPTKANEFRYLRFAWKKSGGTGIMIQFHDPQTSWGHRFLAGNNVFGWAPTMSVDAKIPAEWQVVTRDLFKEFGALNITGFALSPLDGTSGLFDHMLLGRTIEDLDKASNVALGKIKLDKALVGKERDAMWADLLGNDRPKATKAIQSFLASASDQVAYITEKLAATDTDKEQSARIRKLVADLDAENFDTRETATEQLIKMGAPALEAIRVLATTGSNAEVQFRAKLILKKLGATGTPLSSAGKMARVARVLERAGNKDARALLARMAEGEFGFDVAPDAKAALARMPKTP